MTVSSADPVVDLSRQLRSHLCDDQEWMPALGRLSAGEVSLHLAVLTEPFLSLLLDGSKTIESRFSRVRCAPYGVLREGDIVAVKRPGRPVAGTFQAGKVFSYQLTPIIVAELRGKYAAQIKADDDDFWQARADCAYATLVQVTHVRPLPGLPFPKKDRRGWVQLTRACTQLELL